MAERIGLGIIGVGRWADAHAQAAARSDRIRIVGCFGRTVHGPTLSGGMQQRVGIARALSIDPDLLLMDEPFSHLDAITARDLRAELQRLWQSTRATVLFVTHDVMEAVLLSNLLLMMSSAGVIHRDIPIDLPYPRRQTDREVAMLQAEILELFEEMQGRTVTY